VKFMIAWHAVEDDLATVWLNAPDRQDVSAASDALDHLLRTDPLKAGEARDGNTRILIVDPLAVY
jgi:hypothetical protein